MACPTLRGSCVCKPQVLYRHVAICTLQDACVHLMHFFKVFKIVWWPLSGQPDCLLSLLHKPMSPLAGIFRSTLSRVPFRMLCSTIQTSRHCKQHVQITRSWVYTFLFLCHIQLMISWSTNTCVMHDLFTCDFESLMEHNQYSTYNKRILSVFCTFGRMSSRVISPKHKLALGHLMMLKSVAAF